MLAVCRWMKTKDEQKFYTSTLEYILRNSVFNVEKGYYLYILDNPFGECDVCIYKLRKNKRWIFKEKKQIK